MSPGARSGRKERDYLLTPALRKQLKKPLGRLYPAVDIRGDEFMALVTHAPLIVTVGDRATETLQEAMGRSPDVFVVDGMERRAVREVPKIAHASLLKAKNPAGGITLAASVAIKKAFSGKKPAMVLIEGEEDLLTIPVVVEAPLKTVVFYGQPLEGLVAVEVDQSAKERSREILRQMSR